MSLGIVGWESLAANVDAPVSTLAGAISTYLLPVVAATGFAICLVSSNTGVIGVSRVVFSMSHFGLMPEWFSKVNPKTRTPVRSIMVFGLIGGTMALIGNLTWVADLYNFGALLSYLMVNISLIVLRQTDRDTYRSWKVPFSIRVKVKSRDLIIPIPSVVGVIACGAIWMLVVLFHPVGRVLGFSWTLIGITIYGLYRRKKSKPFFSKDIGKSIKPMAYKINSLVLVRIEEADEVVESLIKNIDKRFRLVLQHIVRTDEAGLPLSAVDAERVSAEATLAEMAHSLSASGYEASYRVVVGPFVKTVTDAATSAEVDFVILPRRSAFKKGGKSNGEEDMVRMISSMAPGKLMVVRK